MKENGFSLEEYMEFIKYSREDCGILYKSADKTEAEIYYLPAAENRTEITVPDTCVYQISGNNTDGFIVTVWRNNHGQK